MNSRQDNRQTRRKLVAKIGELAHGMSKKFILRSNGREVEAMLVNYQGEFFAYFNRCPHIGITLDWVDNQFFTVDRRYVMCANHGATFEPATGECIWGPCLGAALQSVPLEVDGENIFARSRNGEPQE